IMNLTLPSKPVVTADFPRIDLAADREIAIDAAFSALEESNHLLASDNPCDVANGHRMLRDCTESLRKITGDEWSTQIVPALRQSQIWEMFLENPLTSRSVRRPRGYAGDAPLIDLIYRHPAVAEVFREATPLDRCMLTFETQSPASRAVCNRRAAIACEIDNIASRCFGSVSCLSIACGHFREAELSQAIISRQFSRFVAIDQDPETIDCARA